MNWNLEELLTTYTDDRVDPPPLTAEALLAAALRRRRRTASVRAAVATLAVSGILLAGVWRVSSTGKPDIPRGNEIAKSQPLPVLATPAELSRELAALEREAAWRSKVVAALAPLAPLPEAPAADDDEFAVSTLSDAEWVRIEAARSAALSWQYANLVEHEFHDAQAARREYERLVARFPGTAWAELATVSLERLLTSEKTPL